MQSPEKKLDAIFAEKLKGLHRKDGTIERYVGHYRAYMQFIFATRGRFIHPEHLNERDLESWLNHLANVGRVAPSTQNQAFYAILSLYKHVIKRELAGVSALRAKPNETIRTPLDRDQIPLLINELLGIGRIAALLMYGTGMRISEVARLRNKDFLFDACQILVYNAKGGKDRVVQFPKVLHDQVRRQMESSRVVWKHDLADGRNGVSLPYAYDRKKSSARHLFGWYYLFPADGESPCPESGHMLRHHFGDDGIRKQFAKAVLKAGIIQKCSPHCLRHSFCTHMLENGVPIQTAMKLMGHKDIRTTEQYLHLCKNGVTSASSPVEQIESIVNAGGKAYTAPPTLSETLANPPDAHQKPVLRLFAG